MSNKFLLRSFAGGEIAPELAGRIDLTKWQTGLALARNFLTLPHGPATRRPGLKFINEAKDSTRPVRLIPFAFSASQTAVLEFGHQYIRFHIGGGTLLESSKAISSIAGSTVNTTASHGYSTGDWVYIGSRYLKATVVDADTFTVADLWGAAVTPTGATCARVYTLTTTYDSADLFEIKFAQSSDVITLTHPDYPAKELKRLGATNWTLTDISFVPSTDSPTDLAVTATIAENKNLTASKYVLTSVDDDGVTETLACDPVSANNNLTLAGNYNTLTWSAVAGKSRYNAYKLRGGIYGYIGQARPNAGATTKTITNIDRPGAGDKTVTVTATAHGFNDNDLVLIAATGVTSLNGAWIITVTGVNTFTYESTTDATSSAVTGTASIPELQIIDDNVLADTTQSPPEDIIALNAGADDYPSATTYHEQRRWFAGTTNKPQVIWATRTATDANLTSSIPSRDADGMELRIAAAQNNQIRHLVPLSDMIALTAGGEFRIFSDSAPAITPSSVSIKPQGYSGASDVQPVVTYGSLLYVQAQGSRVRELAYNWEVNSYRTVDLSIMAPHRFNGYTINQLAFSRAPDPTMWAVRSDGTLLALTYVPDQQVYGWHAHDTAGGAFESVCVVAEGNEDVMYALVRRAVNGRSVRYIERLSERTFTQLEDAYFVDSGLTYEGAPVSTISGLYHLEGQTVDILADGAVDARQAVTGGSISLTTAASKVHVGLPMTSDMTTLPLAMEGAPAAGQGTLKNVNKVHLRVAQSSLVKAGPTFDKLREYPARAVSDPYGSPPALRNGELTVSVDGSWNRDASICVRQDAPLPLTVLSMTLEMQAGG